MSVNRITVYHVLSSWNASQYSGSEKRQQCKPPFPQSPHSFSHHSKSPAAPMHLPRRDKNHPTHHSSHDVATYDLAKFLARDILA